MRAVLARRAKASAEAGSSAVHATRGPDPESPPSSPRRRADREAARDREPPDSGSSTRSRSEKGSPGNSSGLRRSPRLAKPQNLAEAVRRGARIAARKEEVAAAAAPTQPAKPRPPCFWCWHLQPDHAPEQCSERKDRPNMPEYSQGKVVRTRSSGLPKTGPRRRAVVLRRGRGRREAWRARRGEPERHLLRDQPDGALSSWHDVHRGGHAHVHRGGGALRG